MINESKVINLCIIFKISNFFQIICFHLNLFFMNNIEKLRIISFFIGIHVKNCVSISNLADISESTKKNLVPNAK